MNGAKPKHKGDGLERALKDPVQSSRQAMLTVFL
jgi:hypothetical protein